MVTALARRLHHWLTVSVVLRCTFLLGHLAAPLERIGGTSRRPDRRLLAYAAQTPLALAALIFPLCIIGFSARGVSYGFFMACLMPQLVVLVDLIQPGHSSWEIVEMRALFIVVGAMFACWCAALTP